MKRKTLWIPLTLTMLGVLMLAGCIYIPTFGVSVNDTENIGKKIGPADSAKPIRFGVSTRADVEKRFGQPTGVSIDGRHVSYQWVTRSGVFFWPLCFWNSEGYIGDDNYHRFVLTFDDHNVLTKAELDPDDEWIKWKGDTSVTIVPSTMESR